MKKTSETGRRLDFYGFEYHVHLSSPWIFGFWRLTHGRVKEKKAGSPKQRVKRGSGGGMGGGKSVLSLAKSSLCSLANGTMSGIRRASPAAGGAARARQEGAVMTPGPRSKQHTERRSGSGGDWGAESRSLRHRRSSTDFATAPRGEQIHTTHFAAVLLPLGISGVTTSFDLGRVVSLAPLCFSLMAYVSLMVLASLELYGDQTGVKCLWRPRV